MNATEISELSDTRLSEEIELCLGRVACTGWVRGNMGSAGGPVLRKKCEHEWDACYPDSSISFKAMGGTVGGPRKFAESLDALKAGPERVLRDRAHSLEVMQQGLDSYEAAWYVPAEGWIKATAATEERARAEAVLLGLLG